MKINYKEIAEAIERSEANIKYMKKHNQKQFEIIKVGYLCKKYNININDLEEIINKKDKKWN